MDDPILLALGVGFVFGFITGIVSGIVLFIRSINRGM